MKKLATSVLTAAAISVAFAQPAAAAGRPTDGCPPAYAITTVKALQDLAKEAPDEYFVNLDANQDGFLCNRFLPDASTNVGIAHDNHVAGH